MPATTFDRLPDSARVWIYAADRPLSADEQRRLIDHLSAFLNEWKAHGEPLTAACDLRHDRFLLVGVDESRAGASGCSVDALVRTLAGIEQQLSVVLLDHGPVLFRRGDRIERVSRPEFSELVQRGEVTPDTVVFNNTLTRVSDVRAGRWETPARDSWHARAFGLVAAAAAAGA